jgi:hypothetical protein
MFCYWNRGGWNIQRGHKWVCVYETIIVIILRVLLLFVTAVWWEVLRVISEYAGRPLQQLPASCQPRQEKPTAAPAAQPSTAANNVGVPAKRAPAGSPAAPDHVISSALLGHVTWTRSAGTRVYSCATTWRWCPTFTRQHPASSASITRLSPMVGVTSIALHLTIFCLKDHFSFLDSKFKGFNLSMFVISTKPYSLSMQLQNHPPQNQFR